MDQRYPDSADAVTSRQCWIENGFKDTGGYSEFHDIFVARMSRLNQLLRQIVVGHHHVAVCSHCWVLQELWLMHFGQKVKFKNAEVFSPCSP